MLCHITTFKFKSRVRAERLRYNEEYYRKASPSVN